MTVNFDDFADVYDSYRNINASVMLALISNHDIGADRRVLEIGCGTANCLRAMADFSEAELFGIDPATEMLEHGKLRNDDGRLILAEGTAERIPHADGHFDLVFSVDVIHHVTDCTAYRREAFRVLKPGGWLCTVTDSRDDILMRSPLSTYFPSRIPAELERYPSIDQLRDLARAAGFVAIRRGHSSRRTEVTDVQPFRDRAFSSLRLIPEAEFAQDMAKLERDLARGPVVGYSAYTWLRALKGNGGIEEVGPSDNIGI